jgi:glycine betaine catabolism B
VIATLSMYRLMSLSLLGLLAISVGFAGVGLIGYEPLGILAIAAVAITFTALSTLMVASIFRQSAHLESSVITGLLITFILPPTLELRDILGAAAAGAIAGASKYLLVISGRHFLNPAAVGSAVAVGLGLSASFWWVANPPMAIPIVVIGALVAWRSGLGSVALVGLAVGGLALLSRLLVSGGELWSSLYLMLTSYPLVFLALFMLSEPLTMAPRRLSRMAVATVVGLGVALPFSVPVGALSIYSSPELALLAGNLVALAATLTSRVSRSARVQLTHTEKLGDYGAVFTFDTGGPVRFKAGQWIELDVPHRRADRRGSRRVFSVVSAPHEARSDSPIVRIATRRATPGSSFKRALGEAPVTSEARIVGIGGDFVLPKDPSTPLLLLAGGVGVTPFLSQLAEDTHHGITRDVVLVDVRRDPFETWGDETIRASGAKHVITSREGLEAALAEIPDIAHRWCAVSGSPRFVTAGERLLRQLGARSVAKDSFTGY